MGIVSALNRGVWEYEPRPHSPTGLLNYCACAFFPRSDIPLNTKTNSRALVDHQAELYDRDILRLYPFAADRLAAAMQLHPGQKVLDVATGTGAVAAAVTQYVNPCGRVIGVDVDETMLEQAERKFAHLGLTGVDLHVMNGAALEFRARYFDALTCGFGLGLLGDPVAALRGWCRVVKPGARIGFSVSGPRALAPMADMLQARARAAGVDVDSGAYAAGRRLASVDVICAHLEAAGLEAVEVFVAELGYHLLDAQEWWDFVVATELGGLIAALPAHVIEQLRGQHLAEVEPLVGENGIYLNGETLVAVARRPFES